MLAIASVAGAEFSAAAGRTGSARKGNGGAPWRGEASFCGPGGRVADGTVAGRYAFIHSLYQRALRASPLRATGATYLRTGSDSSRVRSARGRDRRRARHAFRGGPGLARAARYHQQAACAPPARVPRGRRPPDAGAGLAQGPADSRANTAGADAAVMLGAALTASRAAPSEVEQAYARALCEQVDDPPLSGLARPRLVLLRSGIAGRRAGRGSAQKPARAGKLPAVRIEAANEWAWCGDERLPLMPRAFAVLRHLVEHAGRLITKDELLATVAGVTRS